MSTITIRRPNVTVEEVSAVLREGLGSRYEISPSHTSHVHHETPNHAGSILVKRNWLEQANVKVVTGTSDTEIHVGGAGNFSLPFVLLNRASIVRKVSHVLEQSTALAGS
jgi:hypothetical protein